MPVNNKVDPSFLVQNIETTHILVHHGASLLVHHNTPSTSSNVHCAVGINTGGQQRQQLLHLA
jgi:hypothetical protein